MIVGDISETLPSTCVHKSSGQCEQLFFFTLRRGKRWEIEKELKSIPPCPDLQILVLYASVSVLHSLISCILIYIYIYIPWVKGPSPNSVEKVGFLGF